MTTNATSLGAKKDQSLFHRLVVLSCVTAAAAVVASSAGAAKVLLGDQAVELKADSNAAGQAEAYQTTASASGTVTKLSVYVDTGSTATKLIAGVYGDAGGHPGTLLAQGSLTSPVAGTS